MGVKVCKFGGSSLADAGQFRKVRAIIAADDERRYVVPSAPGKRNDHDQKVTDLLYLSHEHARQALPFDDVFARIRLRYTQLITDLNLDLDLSSQFDGIVLELSAGVSADYAASRGEFLNGQLMAALLGWPFVDPALCVVFDERGRLDTQATQRELSRTQGEHETAVVPGFYGSTPDGNIITFSRGGSDITGSLVACAAGADVYENWTDVSGMLTTDPRIVDNPHNIEVVTYRELRELAYMGASVLHDEAVFPVREAGIPVNIRNTNDPDHPGTMIVGADHASCGDAGTVTGIAGRKNFTIIAIEKAMMNAQIGYGRRLLSVLEANDVSFEHMPSGIDTISVIVADGQLEGKLDTVLEEIRSECRPDTLDVHHDIALIATVGRGMSRQPGTAAKLFTALADAGVNIRMIDQGSSEMNIIVGVEAEDFELAVRVIYKAFIAASDL
ncbi:MAG: aspartate kinase [Phycisphaeraceae bacterium]|nr:aspartate kinase [Phycisphaeraceae bacterium]